MVELFEIPTVCFWKAAVLLNTEPDEVGGTVGDYFRDVAASGDDFEWLRALATVRAVLIEDLAHL